MVTRIEGIEEKDIRGMYKDKDMCISEIAAHYGVGGMTIHRRMKEYGIDRRSCWEGNIIYNTEEDRGGAKRKNARRFRQSEKGKEATKGFSKSEEGKKARKRYRQSDKGKENAKRYRQTDKGKKAVGNSNAKRRNLEFIPLNEPFSESEFHHFSKTHGIYMPRKTHQSIRHNVFNGKNMQLINKEAFAFLEWEMRDKGWIELENGSINRA